MSQEHEQTLMPLSNGLEEVKPSQHQLSEFASGFTTEFEEALEVAPDFLTALYESFTGRYKDGSLMEPHETDVHWFVRGKVRWFVTKKIKDESQILVIKKVTTLSNQTWDEERLQITSRRSDNQLPVGNIYYFCHEFRPLNPSVSIHEDNILALKKAAALLKDLKSTTPHPHR